MRNKRMLLAALLAAALLAGCAQTPAATTEPPASDTQPAISAVTSDTAVVTDTDDDVIHDIRDWDALRLPDDYSKAAYAFIGQFLGVCEPDFPELAAVQISAYTIRYAEKTLFFDFTVTESGLDTLPPGDYRTEVLDNFGFTLRFLDGSLAEDADFPCEDCRGLVSDFTLLENCWNFPDYGTWGTREPTNFIVLHYAAGDEMTLADYAATAERVLGIPADRARRDGFAETDKDGAAVVRGGLAGVHMARSFVGHSIADGVHSTTVQYFADSSCLIKSHLVEYRIGAGGELLGTTVLNRAAYEPWGGVEEWTN